MIFIEHDANRGFIILFLAIDSNISNREKRERERKLSLLKLSIRKVRLIRSENFLSLHHVRKRQYSHNKNKLKQNGDIIINVDSIDISPSYVRTSVTL